jgi:hypothetical protein
MTIYKYNNNHLTNIEIQFRIILIVEKEEIQILIINQNNII